MPELRYWGFYFKTNAVRTGLAILHFVLIFFCVYSLGKNRKGADTKLFWSAFLVRLAAALILGLVYTYYYSASDTWIFFEDAQKLSALASENFLSYLKTVFDFSEDQNLPYLVNQDSRSIFFIKIISVFCLLSLDSYWICASYFSLLAFTSSWCLHRKITSIFPGSSIASASAFLFFPSVVFWSSGLEKESIAMCGIYFLTIVFLTLMSGGRLTKSFWVLIIPACFVVWSLKYYWAVIFFISIFTAFLMKLLIPKFEAVKKYSIPVWTVLFFGIGVALSFTHPNFYLHRFLEVIVTNYNDFAAISSPKNLIHYFQFEKTWASIIVNSPWALLSGLFRPIIGEGQGLLGWVASIENLFLLVFFAGALMSIKKTLTSSYQIILLTALSYCAVLCVLLALSTPNFGTLSRYRVGFLPFFVFVITYRNPIVEWISIRMGWTHL